MDRRGAVQPRDRQTRRRDRTVADRRHGGASPPDSDGPGCRRPRLAPGWPDRNPVRRAGPRRPPSLVRARDSAHGCGQREPQRTYRTPAVRRPRPRGGRTVRHAARARDRVRRRRLVDHGRGRRQRGLRIRLVPRRPVARGRPVARLDPISDAPVPPGRDPDVHPRAERAAHREDRPARAEGPGRERPGSRLVCRGAELHARARRLCHELLAVAALHRHRSDCRPRRRGRASTGAAWIPRRASCCALGRPARRRGAGDRPVRLRTWIRAGGRPGRPSAGQRSRPRARLRGERPAPGR